MIKKSVTGFAVIAVLFFFASNSDFKASAVSNTYYVATNGSDTANGSSVAPFATFRHAFETMAPGDILIIKNGTYYESMTNLRSGTPSAYTVIKAENDGQVIIDGSRLTDYDYPLKTWDSSYIQIEGIKFKGGRADGTGSGAALLLGSHHMKILRSAFYDTGTRSPDDTGNISTFVMDQSHHILVEDSWAWGYGRYKFEAHESDKIIFRRLVARHDRMDSRFPQALFSIYRSSNTQLQNVIAIDSDQNQFYTGYSGFYGAIFSPNSDTTYSNTGLKILGSVVLNVDGQAVSIPFTLGEHVIKNSVFWHIRSGIGYSTPTQAAVTVDHTTIGDIYGARVGDIDPDSGVGISGFGPGTNIRNSIIYKNNIRGIHYFGSSDYNNLYENGENYGAGWANGQPQTPTAQGPHDRFINPAFRHILRLEPGSQLSRAAGDGADLGANAVKRYGVSGSLWGDPGFEDLTNENLWPWPNEQRIAADMRTYNLGPSGNRGFAAANTTLTRYIWEYLGNPCPADICSGVEPAVSINNNPPPPSTVTTVTTITTATYYVSNSGSDTNPGTQSQPFQTIQRAAEIAQAGAIVLVQDGTYAGFHSVNSGTAAQPIIFRAAGPNVVINSRNENTADNINIENNDYVIIDGFKIRSSARDGIRTALTRGVVISNNTISGSARFGILTGFTPEVQLINNDVSANGEHGIYVSNSNDPNDNPVVRGNRSYNNGQNGIQLNGDINEGGDGIISGGLLEKNIIYGNQLKGLSLISVSNSVIRNNVIYDNGITAGAGGIHVVEQIDTNVYSNNNVIVNNTIFEPRIAAIRINANNVGNVLFNNIAIGRYSIELEGSGNFMDAASNLQSNVADNIFIDANNRNFHLSAGSGALNRGLTSFSGKNAPIDDIEGNTRPQSGIDAGAYELAASNGMPESNGSSQTGNQSTPIPAYTGADAPSWASDAVDSACDLELIDCTLYNPNFTQVVNRAVGYQMLTSGFQVRADTARSPFTDVNGQWFQFAAHTAYTLGWTAGSPAGSGLFAASQNFTRAQMAVAVVSVLGLDPEAATELNAYTDRAQVPSWALGAVAAMVQARLLGQGGNTTLRPNDGVTKVEAIVIMNAAVQYSREHSIDVVAMAAIKMGTTTDSIIRALNGN